MGLFKGTLLPACLACLATSGQLQAQGPRDGESKTVRGTIESMTTAPKGEVDGAVLDDDTILHWPPHLEGRFADAIQRGDRVTAKGTLRTSPEGDVRLEVRTLTNDDTNVTVKNDERRPGPGRREERPAPPRRRAPKETIRGTVDRTTTAPKGEVDGAVLDDGTILHWPPHLADRFAAVVKRGDKVEAIGFAETTPKGDEHFEVASLTNLRTDASAENDELVARRDAPAQRAGDRGRRSADADRAERIRDLKKQLARLQREIEQLEQDR